MVVDSVLLYLFSLQKEFCISKMLKITSKYMDNSREYRHTLKCAEIDAELSWNTEKKLFFRFIPTKNSLIINYLFLLTHIFSYLFIETFPTFLSN